MATSATLYRRLPTGQASDRQRRRHAPPVSARGVPAFPQGIVSVETDAPADEAITAVVRTALASTPRSPQPHRSSRPRAGQPAVRTGQELQPLGSPTSDGRAAIHVVCAGSALRTALASVEANAGQDESAAMIVSL